MATPVISIDSIQFKRGTTENLNKWLEVPQCGEPIFDIDAKKLKIGDGLHLYRDLPYLGGSDSSDQLTFDTRYNFPSVGKEDVLYIAKDEQNAYIWKGNKYEIVAADYNSNVIDGGSADTIF